MSDNTSHDVLVIGAGVAGLAAARETLRAGLAAAYLEAQTFGGLILGVNELDGAIRGIGAEFAGGLMSDVADLGGENLEAVANGIEQDRASLVVTSDAGRHRARAIIIASGATLKKLGVPGEAELEHKGVSHCADCDGPMFQGQEVAVVGGGDSALQSALSLSKYCTVVHLIHRGKALRAQRHFVDALPGIDNIRVHWNSEVAEVLGTDGVQGVRVNGAVIPCQGLFVLIGLVPASAFLPAAIARDARGAVITSTKFETAMPGVYAAGAVRAGCGGSIADAISEGESAARAAAARLSAAATV